MAAAAAAAVNVSGTAVRQSRSPARKVKTRRTGPSPFSVLTAASFFFSTYRRCREAAFFLSLCAWVYVCVNIVLQRLIYGLMWSQTGRTAVITSQPQTSHLLQREPLPTSLLPPSPPTPPSSSQLPQLPQAPVTLQEPANRGLHAVFWTENL